MLRVLKGWRTVSRRRRKKHVPGPPPKLRTMDVLDFATIAELISILIHLL
jgi:hypothetical protein